MICNVVNTVWRHLCGFFGTVFLVFAVISILLVAVEMILYKVRKKERNGIEGEEE